MKKKIGLECSVYPSGTDSTATNQKGAGGWWAVPDENVVSEAASLKDFPNYEKESKEGSFRVNVEFQKNPTLQV